MRWSLEEYERYKRHGPGGQVTEAAFMSAVLRVARANNWLAYHTHNSKRSPEGFPDLVLTKEGCPVIFSEAKTLTGQLTKPQEAWLATLAASTGIVTAVWKPDMLEEIIALLRGS